MDTVTATTAAATRRFLQEALQEEDPSSEGGVLRFARFVEENSTAFIGCVLLGICLIICSTCLIKACVRRLWGITICPGSGLMMMRGRLSREEQQQLLEDERLAMELQQRMNETDRQAAIVQRRLERRKKYEVFLVPYTVVVKEEDLVKPLSSCDTSTKKPTDDDIESGPVVKPSCDTTKKPTDGIEGGPGELARVSTSTTLESESSSGGNDEEDYELYSPSVDNMDTFDAELGVNAPTSTLLDFRQGDGSFLCLPASRSHPKRQVETCCAICITDYEVGDKVVYSCKRDCPHVFHEECIMTWLCKGKKRCPICRHWFVPSTSIDDKKAITYDDASLTGGETLPSEESGSMYHSSDSEEDVEQQRLSSSMAGEYRL